MTDDGSVQGDDHAVWRHIVAAAASDDHRFQIGVGFEGENTGGKAAVGSRRCETELFAESSRFDFRLVETGILFGEGGNLFAEPFVFGGEGATLR